MFRALDQEKISQLRTYTSFWFSPSCTVNFGSLDASLHVHLEALGSTDLCVSFLYFNHALMVVKEERERERESRKLLVVWEKSLKDFKNCGQQSTVKWNFDLNLAWARVEPWSIPSTKNDSTSVQIRVEPKLSLSWDPSWIGSICNLLAWAKLVCDI